MAESKFDHPVAALIDEEDDETLAAIKEGLLQLDRGQGHPVQDLHKELDQRCSE